MHSAVKKLEHLIQIRQVYKWEIFYIPIDIESFGSITPEVLYRMAAYKLTVSGLAGIHRNPKVLVLLNLLKTLPDHAIKKINDDHMDLRWATVFYDNNKKPVLTICLDGLTTKGMINDKPVVLSEPIRQWFITITKQFPS